MATCLEYAKIAFAAYYKSTNQYYANPPGHMVDDWAVQKFEKGGLFGNGFQGGIWQSGTDVVVGCSGTNQDWGQKIQDLIADVKIGLSIMPSQAYSARKMVARAKQIAHGRMVSVCGHSLGGGLAQVAACWEKVPFVSFNSPGMKRTIKASKINVFQVEGMVRSLIGSGTGNTPGVNFRVGGDPVSKMTGGHVGTIVELKDEVLCTATGLGALGHKHGKATIWQSILETDWAFIDPFGG